MADTNGTPAGTPNPTPTVPLAPADSGLTIREAAAVLGVSEKAVRERIKRGTLHGWKVKGKHGEQYRVQVDGTPAVPANGTPTVPHGVEGEGTPTVPADTQIPQVAWESERAALLQQVEWLRGQVEAATAGERAAVERLAEAEREWRQILEREQHSRAALTARQVLQLPAAIVQDTPAEPAQAMDPTMSMEPHETEGPHETAAPRRPWWKVWG